MSSQDKMFAIIVVVVVLAIVSTLLILVSNDRNDLHKERITCLKNHGTHCFDGGKNF